MDTWNESFHGSYIWSDFEFEISSFRHSRGVSAYRFRNTQHKLPVCIIIPGILEPTAGHNYIYRELIQAVYSRHVPVDFILMNWFPAPDDRGQKVSFWTRQMEDFYSLLNQLAVDKALLIVQSSSMQVSSGLQLKRELTFWINPVGPLEHDIFAAGSLECFITGLGGEPRLKEGWSAGYDMELLSGFLALKPDLIDHRVIRCPIDVSSKFYSANQRQNFAALFIQEVLDYVP